LADAAETDDHHAAIEPDVFLVFSHGKNTLDDGKVGRKRRCAPPPEERVFGAGVNRRPGPAL
ncbi:MAG: hypothetical protein WCO00_16975, partial [Rhodospirillaceae bacterium]